MNLCIRVSDFHSVFKISGVDTRIRVSIMLFLFVRITSLIGLLMNKIYKSHFQQNIGSRHP